jgi:N6-L-threonylcarbamoyladenine synthase
VETLVAKCERALDATGAHALNLGGGVACNRALRASLAAMCASRRDPPCALRIPSPRLCADNAGMIAWVGARRLARGERAGSDLDASASLEASGLLVT